MKAPRIDYARCCGNRLQSPPKAVSRLRAAAARFAMSTSGGRARPLHETRTGVRSVAASRLVFAAAGLALTKALSKEYAAHNILVNTVCIGRIKAGQWETRAKREGVPVEKLYDSMRGDIPLGRVGESQEVANVIAFLVSAAASYVTGTSVNLDGGMSGVL